MSALYVETSAVLAWLLGEPEAAEVLSAINDAESVLTSALTDLEVRRSLVRAQAGGTLTDAVALHLLGRFESVSRAWIVMEITPEVLARAATRFPVEPIRSLDAVHLATALEFLRAVEDMQVLSLDGRVGDNIEPLGMRKASADAKRP
jgi:uncharacterized protein with PIN domain